MTDIPAPTSTCVVDGCSEDAVAVARSPATDELTDSRPGELDPLCARHAEMAEEPEVPPKG